MEYEVRDRLHSTVFFMTENACGTSRRSFLSSVAERLLTACLPREYYSQRLHVSTGLAYRGPEDLRTLI